MPKIIKISKVDVAYSFDNISSIKSFLSEQSQNELSFCPWEESYPYKPTVSFQIVHNDSHLFVQYDVIEEFTKGQYIRTNENVWEDSCVEFFLSLDGKQNYYNFEFNVLGTGLIGFGPKVKSERNRLAVDEIEKVDVYLELTKVNAAKRWTSLLVIPKSLFGDIEFSGKTYHGNFYKCGDGLPQPHFIAWNNIENETPNFHLPEYFGELIFE